MAEPDPDTGLFPGQEPLPRLSELPNQTAVQTLLRLERDFGPEAVQTQRWLDEHMQYSMDAYIDQAFEPGRTWPKPPEPTDSELEWCKQPLEELHEWAFEDVCEYYDRSRNYENWTDSEADHFHAWAAAQQKEYERRELVAFDIYAKRRGFMGCRDPVRWKDLAPNDTTTVRLPLFPSFPV